MSLKTTIHAEAILEFARITGDYNPLHVSAEYARLSRFRGQIGHGMFSSILLLSSFSKSLKENSFPKSVQLDFLAPLYPGESLEFEKMGDKYLAIRSSDKSACLEAQFEFSEQKETPRFSDSESRVALELMDYALEELSGKKEESIFTPSQKRVDELNELLKNLGLSPLVDSLAGFSLFLGHVSALVGMKLPGKKATLLDFTWEGKENPGNEALTLLLETETLFKGSERAVLKIQGMHDGVLIGEGRITVMVQSVLEKSFSCEELKKVAQPLVFKNKVAWMVGGSRGIGNVTAKLLALGGAKVVLQYYKGKEAAEESVRDILSHDGQAVALQGDINKADQMAKIAEWIQTTYGGTDIFISTAVDNVMSQDLLSLSSSQMLTELNTTLLGLHETLRKVIPQMQSRRAGKIILLSSIYTEAPEKGQLKYITAKSALTGYVRALAGELAESNIQINMVVPAMTETSLLSSVPTGLLERLRTESTEGRLLTPVEVSNTILFFASTLSNAISGQRLIINRGQAPFL